MRGFSPSPAKRAWGHFRWAPLCRSPSPTSSSPCSATCPGPSLRHIPPAVPGSSASKGGSSFFRVPRAVIPPPNGDESPSPSEEMGIEISSPPMATLEEPTTTMSSSWNLCRCHPYQYPRSLYTSTKQCTPRPRKRPSFFLFGVYGYLAFCFVRLKLSLY